MVFCFLFFFRICLLAVVVFSFWNFFCFPFVCFFKLSLALTKRLLEAVTLENQNLLVRQHLQRNMGIYKNQLLSLNNKLITKSNCLRSLTMHWDESGLIAIVTLLTNSLAFVFSFIKHSDTRKVQCFSLPSTVAANLSPKNRWYPSFRSVASPFHTFVLCVG